MNIGAALCFVLAGAFLIWGLVFALLRERGAILISGFNFLPREQQRGYDRRAMSRDMRNTLFLWCLVLAVGGALAQLFSAYFAIPAFVIWFVLLFKEVHLDTKKAFGKYKL